MDDKLQLAPPRKKAIEPTSFTSPTLQKKLAAEDGTYGNIVRTVTTSLGREEKFRIPPHHPSIIMRRLGYSRNPMTCIHERKIMTTDTLKWRCKDCGEWL